MNPKVAQRGGAFALAAVLFVLVPARAGAEEPPRYDVALEAAPDVPLCDRPDTFRRLVSGMLFDPLLRPPASRVLRASVRRSPSGGYAVRIVTRDAEGNVLVDRRSDYPDIACFEVIWHVALAAATIIEPNPRRKPCPPCPACPTCPTCSEPPPCPLAKPEPKPLASTERRRVKKAAPSSTMFFVGGGLLYTAGLTPEPAPGLHFAAGLGGSRWSVAVDGRVTLPVEVAPLEKTVLQMWTLSASAVPCLWIDPRLGICAVATLGRLGASVEEVPGKALYRFDDVFAFVSVGGRVQAAWPITGSLALRLDAEVVGTIVQTPVRTRLGNSLGETSSTAATMALSIVKSF